MNQKNILILEPDRVLAKNMGTALESAGYSVVTTGSAQAAVSAADRQKPNVIIAELLIPNHNGVEFLYEFRSYPEWQKIPVIVVSSVAPGSAGIDANLLRELGVVEHLYKPDTKLKSLIASVDEAVKT